jgi:two-component system sensor histidine kinase MprB
MAAGVVGAILVLAGTVCFMVMRAELRGQIDDALHGQAARRAGPWHAFGAGGAFERRHEFERARAKSTQPSAREGLGRASVLSVLPNGKAIASDEADLRLPVGPTQRAIASGARRGGVLQDVTADGVHIRLLTVRAFGGGAAAGALVLGRSLESVDRTLGRLRVVLVVLILAGTVLAALLARVLSRPVAAPTEQELARSAGALADSLAVQRQLIADASHELRTPVTSMRTNAELLRDAPLEPEAHRAVAGDVVEQAEELTGLVGDLIDLARGDARDPAVEDVRLDELVREALERARRHAPGIGFEADLDPSVVEGAPERLARAVNNLLDNAAKYSPPDGLVEVAVSTSGELVVRDHGPGITAQDAARLFDRFHRGDNARGRPGTGLGLAIVKQVADAHGGSVVLEPAPGGGTLARLRLRGRPIADHEVIMPS